MPQGGIDALNGEDLLGIKAFQYDMVCNGFEIASGGIRNHLPETMVKAFETVGLDRENSVEERFGGLYRAFRMARRRMVAWRPASTVSSSSSGRRQEPAQR